MGTLRRPLLTPGRLCAGALKVCALGLLLVGGCTAWPPDSNGGMAERQATDSKDILELEHRYAVLVTSGANELAASQAVDVRLLLTRARREYAAGLYDDYVETIGNADLILSRMEKKLGQRATTTVYVKRAEQ